jgi:hypothetical protein
MAVPRGGINKRRGTQGYQYILVQDVAGSLKDFGVGGLGHQ